MDIFFLGTCHGISEKDRFLTSMLLRTEKGSYFIDLGAPIAKILKQHNIPFRDVKTAFVTHMHSDHMMHLPEYVGWCNGWDQTEPRKLYLPEKEDIDSLKAWRYAMHSEEADSKGLCLMDYVRPGVFYDDGNVKVTSIPTKHLKRGKSFGYMFEGEGKKLLFTGDLRDEFDDYPEIALKDEFDAIVCELTHFEVETALPKFNASKTKKIIFNHVREDKLALLKSVDDKIKFEYVVTNDFDTVEI